jgi:hypothetical protein
MAAFQTTFGFTALSSDGAFAVHMAVMLALKRLDVEWICCCVLYRYFCGL